MIKLLLTVFLMFAVLSSCKPQEVDWSKFDHVETLEVSPERWLEIYWDSNNEQLIFDWAGETVTKDILISSMGVDEQLLSLREKNGDLYMVLQNREDITKIRFDFYKLKKGDSHFKALLSKDYPKDIATQNRLLRHFDSGIGANGQKIDQLKMLKDLDVNNIYFMHQYTPRIWVSLETGKEHYEISDTMVLEEISEIAKSYKNKYKPIPLKNIVEPSAAKR